MRCEVCESLLSDYSHGLLNRLESSTVAEHLATCPNCTASVQRNVQFNELIARAAKFSFPSVRFIPPVHEATIPASHSDAKPRSRVMIWSKWAVAALLLIATALTIVRVERSVSRYEANIPTTVAAVNRYTSAHDQLVQLSNKAGQNRNQAEETFARANQKHDKILAAWLADEKGMAEKFSKRKIAVDIKRPAAFQPGAPNDLLVSLRGRGYPRIMDRIEAEVRDQTDAVLYRQRIDPERGDTHVVHIPAQVGSRISSRSELYFDVSAIDEKTGARTPLVDKVRLMGPVYSTLVTTDKPNYKPGERVYFRSLTLDRVTFLPPDQPQLLRYDLRKPSGENVSGIAAKTGSTELVRVEGQIVESVLGPDGKELRGVGCGAIDLPANLSNGDYLLTVTEVSVAPGALPTLPLPATRMIRVRAGSVENIHKRIWFGAASYSPGDIVEAHCEVSIRDELKAGYLVSPILAIDGKTYPLPSAKTGPDGVAILRFPIPKIANFSDVTLTASIRSEANLPVETIVERIPVVGSFVHIEFFPEGGTLVAGVPCRVYIRATTSSGQPVGVNGTVIGRNSSVRVEIPQDAATPGVNRGLGFFTFTPQLGIPYWFKPDRASTTINPAARSGLASALAARMGYRLPTPEVDGIVMSIPDAVTASAQPIRVQIHSVGRPRNLVIGAYTRGRQSDVQTVTVDPNQPSEVLLITGPDPRGGVTRVTVFEDPNTPDANPKLDLVPLAERLVYRKPIERLNLSATPSAASANASIELSLTATDELGKPCPAILAAAVVNSASARNPRDRLLPTHFLLAGEVETPDALEYADFLLSDESKAASTLDLVLATQGWRRFAEQAPVRTGPASTETARLQYMNGQSPVAIDQSQTSEEERLKETYWPQYAASLEELDAARKLRTIAQADRTWEASIHHAAEEVDLGKQQMHEQTQSLRSLVMAISGAVPHSWYATACLTLIALGLAGVVIFKTGFNRASLPLIISAIAAASLACYISWFETRKFSIINEPEMPPIAQFTPSASASLDQQLASAKAEKQLSSDRKKVVATPEAKFGAAAPQNLPGGAEGDDAPPAIAAAAMAPGSLARPSMMPKGAKFSGFTPDADHHSPPIGGGKAGARKAGQENASNDKVSDRSINDSLKDQSQLGVAELLAQKRSAAIANKRDQAMTMRNLEVSARDAAAGDGAKSNQQQSPNSEYDAAKSKAISRAVPLVVVERHYAASRPSTELRAENSQPDTILWQPIIVLPTDGKTTLHFDLSSAPNGYQVLVSGHTLTGRVGGVRTFLPVPAASSKPAGMPK